MYQSATSLNYTKKPKFKGPVPHMSKSRNESFYNNSTWSSKEGQEMKINERASSPSRSTSPADKQKKQFLQGSANITQDRINLKKLIEACLS